MSKCQYVAETESHASIGRAKTFAAHHLKEISLLDRHFLNGQVQGGPSLLDKDTIERLGLHDWYGCSEAGIGAMGEKDVCKYEEASVGTDRAEAVSNMEVLTVIACSGSGFEGSF